MVATVASLSVCLCKKLLAIRSGFEVFHSIFPVTPSIASVFVPSLSPTLTMENRIILGSSPSVLFISPCIEVEPSNCMMK